MAEQHRINEKIFAEHVVLIDHLGNQLGKFTKLKAIALAREQNYDLVEVNSNIDPPVCKFMDYGKFKYHLNKKLHDAKKRQKQVLVKEIKLRPKIENHDFAFKLKKASVFLSAGNKVKVTVQFRGRETSHVEFGIAVLENFLEQLSALGQPESKPQQVQRAVFVIVNPKK